MISSLSTIFVKRISVVLSEMELFLWKERQSIGSDSSHIIAKICQYCGFIGISEKNIRKLIQQISYSIEHDKDYE